MMSPSSMNKVINDVTILDEQSLLQGFQKEVCYHAWMEPSVPPCWIIMCRQSCKNNNNYNKGILVLCFQSFSISNLME